jgi:sulfur carrier protein ThiS adenylyltransferase
MPTITDTDRDLRQRGLVPPARLAEREALVIGVGAIGQQVALQLAALGVARLILYDDDLVEVANLAVQGYWPEDLQCAKVDVTAELCRRILPSIEVTARAERFKRSTPRDVAFAGELVVFCCVDSIVTRQMIWSTLQPRAAFFVDGRMNAEVLRVIAVSEPALDAYYARTLFPAQEAVAGTCTARSTLYTASIAAGLMIHQFTRWLRRIPVDSDLTLNLLAGELMATCVE